jgi:acetolactate synthase-1/2/3 large subunit
VTVPAQLIHVDINPAVFDANYPAQVKIEGDATVILGALLTELQSRTQAPAAGDAGLSRRMAGA